MQLNTDRVVRYRGSEIGDRWRVMSDTVVPQPL